MDDDIAPITATKEILLAIQALIQNKANLSQRSLVQVWVNEGMKTWDSEVPEEHK